MFLPQSAILGTGAVVKKPGVVTTPDGTDAIAVRSYVYLALSYDHRIIDGADAARLPDTGQGTFGSRSVRRRSRDLVQSNAASVGR